MNTTLEGLLSPQIVELHGEIIRDFRELEDLSAHWQRLWEADPRAEIFQHFAWSRAWWRSYGGKLKLCCIVIWRGEAAVGFLPLVERGGRLFFLGAPQADYSDFIAEQEHASDILSAALRVLFAGREWKEGVLEHVSSGSRLFEALQNAPPELRRTLRLVPAGQAPTILISKQPEWLGSLAAKKHLRRRENKLAESASVQFRFLESREQIRRRLPEFFQHQIRRRILHGQASSCLQPEFSALLTALIEELDPREQVRFGILECGGRPLAYHLGFLAKGKFTMYQQAFDVDAWDWSPGEVLLRRLFLYADEHVEREFDFSVGEEPYKVRFANHFKPNFTVYIEPRQLGGLIRQSYRAVSGRTANFRRTAKAAVRSKARIYQLARQARRWAAELHAIYRDGLKRFQEGRVRVQPAGDTPASELITGRLSDLADLYLELPSFRLSSRLLQYRARLRQGDAVHILRMGGRPALIAWTAKDSRGTERDVYECTFLKGERKAAYRTLLELLAAQNGPEPSPGARPVPCPAVAESRISSAC